MKTRYYLAYGSNLNLRQMKFRCPGAKPVGTTTLEGYKLLFRGPHEGAVATVEPKVGSSVPVLIWETTPKDELALDHYEATPFYTARKTSRSLLTVKKSKPTFTL